MISPKVFLVLLVVGLAQPGKIDDQLFSRFFKLCFVSMFYISNNIAYIMMTILYVLHTLSVQ